MSLTKQIIIGLAAAAVMLVGRQLYYGQIVWISPIKDQEVREYVERTSSFAGYNSLEEFLPEEFKYAREEIVRQIKFERRGIVSNKPARKLLTEIRRRNAHLLASASDELNKQVIAYNQRWLEAVDDDADMCGRVFALGDDGVLYARTREFVTDEILDNSVLFAAMRNGQDSPTSRTSPVGDDWALFFGSLTSEGFDQVDFEILDPDNIQLPASCAAMARYLEFVQNSKSAQAEQIRAHIAKSLSEL